MTSTALYSLRTDGDQWRITKFVDGDVESSYLCTEAECECPAGHRQTCRHRQMLPQMLGHHIENTHWFMMYDAGGQIVDFNGTPKRLFDELAAVVEPASRPAEQDTSRHTFTVPDGYEAIRDSDGRATGEVRLISTAKSQPSWRRL